MTRDDIIRMAREIFDVTTDGRGRETFSGDSFGIERFAELVSAAERERAALQTEQLGMVGYGTLAIAAAIRKGDKA